MSTKAKKKDCKDFPSFSCQGKGLHGFIDNDEFSAENIFVYIVLHVLQSHSNRPSQSECT